MIQTRLQTALDQTGPAAVGGVWNSYRKLEQVVKVNDHRGTTAAGDCLRLNIEQLRTRPSCGGPHTRNRRKTGVSGVRRGTFTLAHGLGGSTRNFLVLNLMNSELFGSSVGFLTNISDSSRTRSTDLSATADGYKTVLGGCVHRVS